jgi:predicted ATP-dependent serine protease
MDAFDRLVGDARHRGMVHNGLYLVAGPPGIGKTTLTTQVAAGLAQRGEVVLLATGEEARDQVDDRWRFDAPSNQVRWAANAGPVHREFVRVSYEAACLPRSVAAP